MSGGAEFMQELKEAILEYFQGRWAHFYQRYGAGNFRKQGKDYTSSCPLHREQKASFAITTDGKWYCHAEKIGGDCFNFYARKHGLNERSDFREILSRIALDFNIPNGGQPASGKNPPPWKRPVEETYDYQNEAGEIVFHVVRFADGLDPKFMQGRPKAKGSIDWGLKGTKPVLYHLPEVMQAQEVFLCEGEKDADNIRKLGLVGTTIPMGAISKEDQFHPQYAEALRGKDVILCGDNDEPGRQHVQACARALYGTAKSIRILEFPNLPHKGDVTDWLRARQAELKPTPDTREEFLKTVRERLAVLFDTAKPYEPSEEDATVIKLVTLGDIHRMEVEFPSPVIDGLLDRGDSLLLTGGSGLGKSLFTLATVMAVASGGKLFGEFAIPEAMPVLLVQSENSLKATKQRLNAIIQSLQGSPEQEKCLRAIDIVATPMIGQDCRLSGNLLDKGFFENLRRMIEALAAGFFVLDPLISYHRENENDNTMMRAVLDRITELCSITGSSVMVSHHHGKTPHEGADQSRGATAIKDWARGILTLNSQPNNHDRILVKCDHTKHGNFPKAKSLLLEIDGPRIVAVEPEVLCPPSTVAEVLDDMGGHVDKKTDLIKRLIEKLGIGHRTAVDAITKAEEFGIITTVKVGRCTAVKVLMSDLT
jgi:hypothetical protein